ncbi:hypothetical protein DFH09DRAFT_1183890 [Mycena vulgaris]|nr:hypothetical protein DFH09DRAFT_1183890 [Mycena vulgaris]
MHPPIAYLHLLPVEVWLACWTLCSLQQLRRLSLVCRLFRSISLPLVFRSQSFDVEALRRGLGRDNWMDRVRHLHRTAVRLDRLIQSPYAPFVRSWKVAFMNGPASRYHPEIQNIHLFDAISDRVASTFSTTLGLYQNLSALDIRRFTIDTAFRTTLLSLSRLKDLTLFHCDIVAWDGFLRLGSLKITSRQVPKASEEPLQIASPDTIRTLSLYWSSEMALLRTGYGHAKLPHLVHLSIDVLRDVDVTPLFRFLERCPQLECLAIKCVSGQSTRPDVHPYTISLLHTLAAPPKFIQLFAPNHPVSGVTILGGGANLNDLMDVCMDISRSPHPLHSLVLTSITPTLEFLVGITRLFPELKELTILVKGYPGFLWGGVSRGRRRATIPVDQRSLDLCDDDAFDNPPVDDVSDTESEEPNRAPTAFAPLGGASTTEYAKPVIIGSTGIHNILRWIFTSQLTLPPNLEVLRLELRTEGEELSLVQQHRALVALSLAYPLLRKVQFGFPSNSWERTGGMWKRQVESAESRKI